MCSEVIHSTARRRSSKSPPAAVNNFAATEFAPVSKFVSGRIAPMPAKVPSRLPPEGPAQNAAQRGGFGPNV
jgi:hypothetical protein